jgi:phenylpyruvate tautomerase PptA (4-oxalocrotonate tautomerase family)
MYYFMEFELPTYIVAAAASRLTTQMKQEIASRITTSHSGATGAQGFFAQVIFHEIAEGDHFLGGRPLKSDHLYVHGHIRAGRTPDQKQRLLDAIVNGIADAAATESRYVWVYLSELPPSQMVEYGKVLPSPGDEAAWLEPLSAEDREYLLGNG